MSEAHCFGSCPGHVLDGRLDLAEALGTKLLALFVVLVATVHVLKVAKALNHEREALEQPKRFDEFHHISQCGDLTFDTFDDDHHECNKVFPLQEHLTELIHDHSSSFSGFGGSDSSFDSR